MRIASLTLRDFELVKDSGISEMSVTFTELVQLIIGSNGSGKSSTLRQLSVYPAVRSLFGKNGHKILVVEKDGIYYRLESEYEKPSSPHLFFEGDSEENLNIGRTTSSQQDLIIQYLGITPLMDDLIMNRLVFPKMGSARRKEFLMGANPAQIGFVLVQIKMIASKIKACKNNIARLQSRKILLEQDLLDDETMEIINQEKQAINEDLHAFQQNLMDIEVGLRTTQEICSPKSLTDLPSIRKTVKRYHYQLSGLAHVNRDDDHRQHDRETVLSKIAVCKQRMEEADTEIVRQSGELEELETRYRELALEGDLFEIDAKITRLELDRDKLQTPRPLFELSQDNLNNRLKELDVLRDRLLIFSDLSITLLSTKRRQHRERMLSSSQYKQSSYRQRLSDLETRYASLSERHKLKPRDIPDSPCAKDRCPLYSHFMGEYTHTEEQRTSVQKAIEKGLRKIDRLDRFVDGLLNYLKNSQPYVDQIQWLIGYAQSNPILHHILRQMDILSVLSTNPNRIINQLHDAYDQIARWLKLKSIVSDLETAYAFKSRQISSESHDTIKLVTHIEDTKKSLYGLRNATIRLSQQKKRLEEYLRDITNFSEIKSGILAIQKDHQTMMEALAHDHERTKLILLKKGVSNLRDRHFSRLGEIEKTLNSQAGLRIRYQEEVIAQLAIIEKEMADLQQIETALVITTKEIMIDFINSVFEQANRLIASVWTIPLTINLLKSDDLLNYEFIVTGDNDSVRELSECSEGQTEILSLAINLSLRIILGYLNYPLCLDESGRTFDDKHKQNLISLLRKLLDDRVISQLFLVSHHAVVHEGFADTETLVIREDNVLLPSVYNLHATLT